MGLLHMITYMTSFRFSRCNSIFEIVYKFFIVFYYFMSSTDENIHIDVGTIC